jgi:hypothetical protein
VTHKLRHQTCALVFHFKFTEFTLLKIKERVYSASLSEKTLRFRCAYPEASLYRRNLRDCIPAHRRVISDAVQHYDCFYANGGL